MPSPDVSALLNYCAAVSDADEPQPCKYGHRECALRKGGRCSNEVWLEAYAMDPEAAEGN